MDSSIKRIENGVVPRMVLMSTRVRLILKEPA